MEGKYVHIVVALKALFVLFSQGFLLRYVDIVETQLNQVLTLHQADEYGMYGRHDSEK